MKIELMSLNDLNNYGHDVYEFCYGKNYPPNHWNDNSLFLKVEDFLSLSSFLDKIFSNYHYYGPQKITLNEWESVKKLCLSSNKDDYSLLEFFTSVDKWINQENNDLEWFWILGV